MMGFMTKKEALALGYTNHGKYFGLPVWLAEEADGGLMVAAKCTLLDWMVWVIGDIENLLRNTFFPNDEPGFQFWMGPRIEL